MPRILTIIVLLFGAFLAPWWLVAIALLLSAYAHPRFVEGIGIALLADVALGAYPIFGIPGFLTFVACTSVLLFFMSEPFLRSHVVGV